jgi:hypothetical protein
VIIVTAFLIRLGFALWELMTGPVPLEYGWETGRIAQSIALGKGFSNPYPGVATGPTALFAPIYPYFLAGIFKIFGVQTYLSYVVAIFTNGLFSALTCLPIYKIAQRIGGTTVAAVSCWLWAIFPTAVIVPAEWIWDTSLVALLLALILWATLVIGESNRVRDWVGYGALWGFGLLVNPSVGSLLPFLLGWIVWTRWKARERWFRLPATALLVAFLCTVPWTVRNYVVFHKLMPLRSNFGLELWLGNNNEQSEIIPDIFSPYTNPPLHREYVKLGEVDFMKTKQAEAMSYIKAHPGIFLRTTWFRFTQTWLAISNPIRDVWPKFSLRGRIALICNVFAVLAGFSGLLLLFRQKPAIAKCVAFLPLVFPCVNYITHPSLRYRHPIDSLLLILSAFACAHLVRKLAGRRATASSSLPIADQANP